MVLNDQLKAVYQKYLANFKIISKQFPDGFSYPLLMKAFPDYNKATRKILFVGKETFGWGETMKNSSLLSVDYLMNCYEEFEFAKNYHGRSSPFWRFVRIFQEKVNGSEFPNGLLWTNFSKCDSSRTTPTDELQKLNHSGFDLIKDEIKITIPDIIIFITGWNYEHEFQRVFQGLKYDTIEDNYIYKCNHPLLPDKTYMTMHPNGLNFRGKLNSTIDKIIKQL